MIFLQGKKADLTWEKMIALAIGIFILIIAIVVFINPSGKSASQIYSSLGSCGDPLIGEDGECDCFFEGECPPGTEKDMIEINRNCPITCNEQNFIQMSDTAKKAFNEEIKALEKELKTELTPDQIRMIEPKHFGQCCVGAKRETSS